jgi:hypothetical protein
LGRSSTQFQLTLSTCSVLRMNGLRAVEPYMVVQGKVPCRLLGKRLMLRCEWRRFALMKSIIGDAQDGIVSLACQYLYDQIGAGVNNCAHDLTCAGPHTVCNMSCDILRSIPVPHHLSLSSAQSVLTTLRPEFVLSGTCIHIFVVHVNCIAQVRNH